MAERYLAVSWPDEPMLRTRGRREGAAVASAAGLAAAFDGDRLAVFASKEARTLDLGGAGLVLGTLFHRDGDPAALNALGLEAAGQIVRTSGQSLIDDYWGGYVALFTGSRAGAPFVLRDPTGMLPCFHAQRGGLTFVFSDLELAGEAGLIGGSLDWTSVAQHLAYPGLRAARTGLAGVSEVLAGTRLSLGPAGETAAECCWSPWSFTGRGRVALGPEAAAERLGAELRRCVGAWASQSPSVLLQLSGGLDSSIVAACLSETQTQIHCVTLTTPHPGADERPYAQQVAEAIGAPLNALMLDLDQAEAQQGWARPLTRPGINVLQRAVDRAIVEETRRVGASGIFSGGGGDSVFCFLETAAPAADALLARGPGASFARSVADLAALHQCTLWRAASVAMKKAMRPRARSWRLDRQFLSDEACAVAAPNHPWSPGPPNALPGQREQVVSLMGLQSIADGSAQIDCARVRHPLLSQPLVELCLGIPSWMWIAGGRNRAVARDAFAQALPPAILGRRTKGDFSGFTADIFDRQRPRLREQLLDGALADRGLLDRPAIERFLAEPIRPRESAYLRLFLFADVETWIGSWTGAPSSVAAAI